LQLTIDIVVSETLPTVTRRNENSFNEVPISPLGEEIENSSDVISRITGMIVPTGIEENDIHFQNYFNSNDYLLTLDPPQPLNSSIESDTAKLLREIRDEHRSKISDLDLFSYYLVPYKQ